MTIDTHDAAAMLYGLILRNEIVSMCGGWAQGAPLDCIQELFSRLQSGEAFQAQGIDFEPHASGRYVTIRK